MTSEDVAIASLSEGEFRWLEVWNWQVGALDQKACILVTLDGILLALTASFVGTVLSSSVPLLPRIFFAASTILVLFSAAACTRVIWVRFYATKIIADHGTISKAYPKMFQSRANKMGYLPTHRNPRAISRSRWICWSHPHPTRQSLGAAASRVNSEEVKP